MATKVKSKPGVQLPPPVTAYSNRLKALLECDPDVKVSLAYEEKSILVTVHDPIKAAAWREILPTIKEVGTDKVTIDVINSKHEVGPQLFLAAMTDNSAFSRLYESEDSPEGMSRSFCYFVPGVIQFSNDNFSSPELIETRTAEDLAKEVLDIPTLNFCTEIGKPSNK